MRNIVFRAKSLDDNLFKKVGENPKFFFGDLMHDGGESFCLYFHEDGSDMQIDPDTVGEFTGLYDSNKREIFEGDIVENNYGTRAEVIFEQGCWCLSFHDFDVDYFERNCLYDFLTNYKVKVIGNVHDNPELVEKLKNEK